MFFFAAKIKKSGHRRIIIFYLCAWNALSVKEQHETKRPCTTWTM